MSLKNTAILMPARYNSKRLPGKPLIKINNKYLFLKTLSRIQNLIPSQNIFVMSDEKKVIKIAEKNKYNGIYSKKNFLNGTERCSYCLKKINKNFKYFIIVSCDMPFLDKRLLKILINKFENKKRDFLTIHTKIKDKDVLNSKHTAKIALTKKNRILYLSRSRIPYLVNKGIYHYSHHGLVMIKSNVLKKYFYLKQENYQKGEDNEWLKLIENDYIGDSILVNKIKPEINTKSDLKKYFPILFKKK